MSRENFNNTYYINKIKGKCSERERKFNIFNKEKKCKGKLCNKNNYEFITKKEILKPIAITTKRNSLYFLQTKDPFKKSLI